MTAADYLRHCHGFSGRMIIRLKQDCGSLAVNGAPLARAVDPLSAGDILTVTLRPEEQAFTPNPSLSLPVVYEDEDVAVFAKPAGMPVHPSHRHREDTLANFFAARIAASGEEASFHAINRLDRDTSGLCVVAKHPYAADRLSKKVEKVYYAVAEGEVTPDEGTLSFPIARAGESIILRKVDPKGKEAVTHYRVLKRGGGHTLLRIVLETGRTHQIRVHFSHIGHPLAGDDLYGGSVKRLPRQALHCGEVTFPHPVTGEKVSLFSSLPPEWEALFSR